MKAIKWAVLSCLLAALGAPAATAQGEVKPTQSEAAASAIEAQTQAIARLIKVWNFVKYHHADALSGNLAMDPEFFTLYPKLRAAASLAESDAILAGPANELIATSATNPK